jgi:hypothetical protein
MHNSIHVERNDHSALYNEWACLAFFRWTDGGLFTEKIVTLKGIVGIFGVFREVLTHVSLQKSHLAQQLFLTSY